MRVFWNHETYEIHERGKNLKYIFVWFVYFVVEMLLWDVEVGV